MVTEELIDSVIKKITTGVSWIERWKGDAFMAGDEVDLGLQEILKTIEDLKKLKVFTVLDGTNYKEIEVKKDDNKS